MTRVAVSRVKGNAYVRILADYRKEGSWHQVVVQSHGRLTPENHARAIASNALLDRLEIELRRGGLLLAALEAEVQRILGSEAIANLKRALDLDRVQPVMDSAEPQPS